WFDIKGGPLARAYHLLQGIDLGPAGDSGRGPLLEFNVGSHPGDNTHYVNAKDKLSLSLLQARLSPSSAGCEQGRTLAGSLERPMRVRGDADKPSQCSATGDR